MSNITSSYSVPCHEIIFGSFPHENISKIMPDEKHFFSLFEEQFIIVQKNKSKKTTTSVEKINKPTEKNIGTKFKCNCKNHDNIRKRNLLVAIKKKYLHLDEKYLICSGCKWLEPYCINNSWFESGCGRKNCTYEHDNSLIGCASTWKLLEEFEKSLN
jgi:hypothetical protein